MKSTLRDDLDIRLAGAQRVAIVGIGSQLKSDDAVGIITAEKILAGMGTSIKDENIMVLLGHTAPENLTGKIIKFKPSHIVLIDCADFGKDAGYTRIVEPKELSTISFSTHTMPANMMVDYIQGSVKCQIIFIGIQPKSLEFGGTICNEVISAADQASRAILDSLSQSMALKKSLD